MIDKEKEEQKQKLKVGIIGSGFIAQFQARAMQSCPRMELTGILNRKGSEKFAQWTREAGLGPAKIYSSIKELCVDVDCVAVYVPNFAQLQTCEEIANAKLKGASVTSIIIDKPLGRNLMEASRIVQLMNECQLKTAYFENQIHMKSITSQRHQLKDVMNAMGPPKIVRSAEEHSGPHMPWFWDPIRSGGGVLLDMGCHSIAVGWFLLTPHGKPINYLRPIKVSCTTSLLKWGDPVWAADLKKRMGVDYTKTPAEDFATGIITFLNPESGQESIVQFTDSWMYDKQGLRLSMEGLGAGYGFEINTLQSPVHIFIGDTAAQAVLDQEDALEKSTASRGLLPIQPNEPDLYGYTDENQDACEAFLAGRDAKLPLSYGYEITKLVMACYMAAEEKREINLLDPAVQKRLKEFIPKVQRGEGL